MHASIVILDSRGERLFARGQVVLSSIIGLSPTNPAHLSACIDMFPSIFGFYIQFCLSSLVFPPKQETGFLRQFLHHRRDQRKKPGFSHRSRKYVW